MSWTQILPVDKLASGDRQVIKLEAISLLLLNHDNKIYAIKNVCPHLKLPLKKGKITPEGTIVCPWHRSEFDLDTGEVQTWCPWPPAVGKLLGKVSTEKALTVFPTRIEDGQIAVQLPASD